MRSSLIRAVAVVLAGVALLVPAPAADAVTGPWQVLEATGPTTNLLGGNTIRLEARCPANYSAVSGYYTDTKGHDLRRITESIGVGPAYQVTLDDESSSSEITIVQAHVRCVPSSYFTNAVTQSASAHVDPNTQIATGSVTCPNSWSVLGAYVYTAFPDNSALLTSSPTANKATWEMRAWNGNDKATYQVYANCVPSADLDAARGYSHTDTVGWGAGAGAECGAGMKPLSGGTQHLGGDSGAITEYAHPTATGWTSTTLSLSTGSMLTTVICVPAANPTLALGGSSGASTSTSATWTFSASDPAAAAGYSMSYTCTIYHPTGATSPVACTSPVQVTGLSEGSHSIRVRATTSDGRIAEAFRSVFVDNTAPLLTFGVPGNAVVGTASPTLGFDYQDPYLGQVTGVACELDGVPMTCAAQVNINVGQGSVALSGLSNGPHTLTVTPTDWVGHHPAYSLPFVVDTVAPTVKMTRPGKSFQLALSTTAAWSGMDATSGIARYQVRWQRAGWNSGFGSWSTPITLTGTSRKFGSLAPGYTYCYSTRATDKASHTGAWASSRCTAVPLDERSLTRSSGWTSVAKSSWFKRTGLYSRRKGATLSKAATVKRIEVVAQSCPRCGVVGLYAGSTLLKKINLASATTARRTYVLPTFSLRRTTVRLVVLSTNHLVSIDALGLSRK